MPARTLLNHLLQQNPTVRRQLSGFNGLVLALSSEYFSLRGRINGQGLLDATERPADAAFYLHPPAVHALLQGNMPDLQQITVDGDTELAWHLLLRLAQLRYRPRQDIRRLFGEEAAATFGQVADRTAPLLRGLANLLASDGGQTELQRENARLRRDLAQLQQRLAEHASSE